MDHVQKLQEDGRERAGDGGLREVAPVREPVTEGEPLLLDQYPEPLQGAVVRVQAQLGHRRDLQHADGAGRLGHKQHIVTAGCASTVRYLTPSKE